MKAILGQPQPAKTFSMQLGKRQRADAINGPGLSQPTAPKTVTGRLLPKTGTQTKTAVEGVVTERIKPMPGTTAPTTGTTPRNPIQPGGPAKRVPSLADLRKAGVLVPQGQEVGGGYERAMSRDPAWQAADQRLADRDAKAAERDRLLQEQRDAANEANRRKNLEGYKPGPSSPTTPRTGPTLGSLLGRR
jgi:hypothetical protein